ncbi:MAG: glycosyltransferase [Betaproteobacteria bacterium]|nr:glycosyltransferase [Betaproteobacteria bacterium]
MGRDCAGIEEGAPRLVSVIMPAYNCERTVAESIEGVLAQTYRPIELLVVDDGSSDRTRDVLEGYRDRVRIEHQANGGVASARNSGITRTSGEFVALIDCDDLCDPDRIALQVAALDRFPEAVACSTSFSAFDAEGEVSPDYGSRYYSSLEQAPGGLQGLYPRSADVSAPGGGSASARLGSIYEQVAFGNFVHPPTFMVRRSAIERAGLQDTALRYTSDWEWIVRLARTGPFVHLDRPLLRYRLSPGQLSGHTTSAGTALGILDTARKIFEADPALARRNAARVRAALREFHLDAAYALSATCKREAFSHLLESLRLGERSTGALRIALRIGLPAKVLERLRRARAGPTGA